MPTFVWAAHTVTADWTDTSEWLVGGQPVDQFPAQGSTALIGAGTVELDFSLFDTAVTLYPATYGSPAVTILATNVDLGDRTRLVTAAAPNQFGPIIYDVIGTGTLNDASAPAPPTDQPGTIDSSVSPLTIELSALSATNTAPSFLDDGFITGSALSIAANTNATAATFINNGTIDITGPLSIAAGVTLAGSGVVALDGLESSASIEGAVGPGQLFRFTGFRPNNLSSGTLVIGDIGQFQGTIDVSRENSVRVMGVTLTGIDGSVVSFSNGSTLDIQPVGDGITIEGFSLTAPVDQTTLFAACFGAGTRIATMRGECAVEDVRVGDRVVLARGGTAAAIWVGARTVRCDRHPDPESVWPVRVAAHAFAPGQPSRGLLLSPDHAVAFGRHLIPVRHLRNGATIVQERVDSVRYHHIELAQHDLLLAEALACESYLDTGNRAAFDGGGPALLLHPDFSRAVWTGAGCLPLAEAGAPVHAARRALLRQAARLGHRQTGDPALRLFADGRRLRLSATIGGFEADLPPRAAELRLVSRVWVPAQMRNAADWRTLGVALGRIWLDGREVGLDSPALGTGWHAPEPGLRWTDGEAALAVAGVRKLAFSLAMAGSYWRCDAGALRVPA